MGIPNRKYFNVKRRKGEAPVSQTPLENPENPLNPNGSGGGAEGQIPPVSQRYNSESEMIADQGNQRSGFLYFDGTNTWWYLGTDNGDVSDYFLFANGDELATFPHNSTTGKQGGDPVNDFYGHVTEEQLEGLIQLLSPPDIDRISQVGTISFVSPTELNAIDWKAIFSGVELDTTPLNISGIEGTPTDYDRGDALYYKPDGTLGYSVGYEDPEGTPLPPAIPDGTLRMADILRTPTGVNVIDYVTEQLSDFVSKSELGNQVVQSNFGSAKLAGGLRDYIYPNVQGIFRKIRGDYMGVYSTLSGSSGYSRLLRIDATTNNQGDYKVDLELTGVKSQTGQIWIRLKVDGSGDMVSNELLVDGDFDPSKFIMVKVASYIYDVFVKHTETADFFKWRPKFSFGSSEKYTYYHQEALVALPVGDQYAFSLFGDPIDSTGSEIRFDKPRTYGEIGTPITATTLTENNTGLRKLTQVLFHQAASFNPPATWELSTGSDDYDPAKINVIYVEAFSATYKRYIIDHDE